MASYTDVNPPVFTPYIAHQDVDLMAKVGMTKQSQYEQGYEKIQDSIDQVAGLDIYRDVDRQYLQSKLNDLKSNLNSVAAGDFSNFQLTNSVAGMAGKLANDTTVINSVKSTANYKKGLKEIDAARKAGKSGASNEWYYRSGVDKWQADGTPGAEFNETYTPVSEYRKRAEEVVKALAKNSTENDVAVEYDKNGNMVLLDAMTRTKISGITPERVAEALKVGLSTSDWKQLQIDGLYQYSNVSDSEFIQDTNTEYLEHIKGFEDDKQTLLNSLTTTTNVNERLKINQEIKEIDNTLERVRSEYKDVADSFLSGNADSAKANRFTKNWVNSFSKTFASSEVSQLIMSSPLAEAQFKREAKRQEWLMHTQNLEQRREFHNDDNIMEMMKLKESKRANDLKETEITGYGPIGATLSKDEAPVVTYEKVKENSSNELDVINYKKSELIAQYRGPITANMSAEQRAKKTAEDERWLTQQLIAYGKNSKSFSGDKNLANSLADIHKSEQDHLSTAALIAGLEKDLPSIQRFIPSTAVPLIARDASGRTTNINPQDFVSYIQKMKEFGKSGTSGSYMGVTAKDKLTPTQLQQLTSGELRIYESQQSTVKNDAKNVILKNLHYYEKNVYDKYEKELTARKTLIGKRLQQKIGDIQGYRTGIPLGTAVQKDSFKAALIGWAENNGKLTGFEGSPGVTKSTILAGAADLSSANVLNIPATKYSKAMKRITIMDSKGVEQTFSIPETDYQSVFRGQFDVTPEVKAFQPLEEQMIWMGSDKVNYRTTALDNAYKTSPSNSFLNPTNFPNVSAYTVTGNIVEGKKGSEQYQFRLNIYDPVTKSHKVEDFPFPIGGLMDKGKVVPTMQKISDFAIFELLNNRKPTPAELKQLKLASEKQ